MRPTRFPALALSALCASLACSDHTTGPAPSEVATINVTLNASEIEVGQFDTATVILLDQSGAPIDKGPVTWTSTFPEVAAVQPTTGKIFAFASGMTQIIATIDGKEGHQTVTVSPPPILVNEVFPNGDLPGGWVELFNPTARAVDMTGWTISSEADFLAAPIAPGTIIPSGGYFIVEEASFPFGLDAFDGVHLFSRFGIQSNSAAWRGNPPTTLGRCPDGRGAFAVTVAPSKGAANLCP